jgi:hypothetical protein
LWWVFLCFLLGYDSRGTWGGEQRALTPVQAYWEVSFEQKTRVFVAHYRKMPLANEVVEAAMNALRTLGAGPDAELNTDAFAREKIIETRAALRVVHNELASIELPRTDAELREELYKALKGSWREVLQRCPVQMLQPLYAGARADALLL